MAIKVFISLKLSAHKQCKSLSRQFSLNDLWDVELGSMFKQASNDGIQFPGSLHYVTWIG